MFKVQLVMSYNEKYSNGVMWVGGLIIACRTSEMLKNCLKKFAYTSVLCMIFCIQTFYEEDDK